MQKIPVTLTLILALATVGCNADVDDVDVTSKLAGEQPTDVEPPIATHDDSFAPAAVAVTPGDADTIVMVEVFDVDGETIATLELSSVDLGDSLLGVVTFADGGREKWESLNNGDARIESYGIDDIESLDGPSHIRYIANQLYCVKPASTAAARY